MADRALRRGHPWLRRSALIVSAVLLGLALVAVTLYFVGGEMPPAASIRNAYAAEVDAGAQAPVRAAFVIPIPGCVCHSPDPAIQMTHSVYHLSECASCHG